MSISTKILESIQQLRLMRNDRKQVYTQAHYDLPRIRYNPIKSMHNGAHAVSITTQHIRSIKALTATWPAFPHHSRTYRKTSEFLPRTLTTEDRQLWDQQD